MSNMSTNLPVGRGKSLFIKSLTNRNKVRSKANRDYELDNFFEAVECAKQDLQCIQELLDSTADPDIIEYAIYQERAAQLRLSYLVRKAKEKNIKAVDFASL